MLPNHFARVSCGAEGNGEGGEAAIGGEEAIGRAIEIEGAGCLK